ncbi:hypothetical protein LCGC14_0467230 [marine sediment metagenome]|uniref:Uncharacterized protein n=1 Tax=marine sediment metagenome TaxID=412755 RepID=A0A0F9SDC2_9ZZZZ
MGDVLLNGVAVTGAGSSKTFEKPKRFFAFKSFWVANGDTVTVVKIDVEWSADPAGVLDADATWFTLVTHTYTADEITALAAGFFSSDKLASRIRGNLKTYTGSGGDADFTLELEDSS